MPKKDKNVIIDYKEKGEKMANNKTQPKETKKVFAKYSYTKKSDHPKLDNIDLGAILPTQKSFLYNIMEMPKGVSFCVTYEKGKDDFQINFKNGETVDKSEFYLTLDANINAKGMSLYKPFRELSLRLGYRQVDFTVFVEYISFKSQKCKYFEEGDDTVSIIVTDIFINSNWVRQKDMARICSECGLFTMPILYEGVYNKDIIEVYANDVYSYFSKKDKPYGVMIKSVIEDEKDSKRMAAIKLNKRFEALLPVIVPKDGIEKEVEDYITRNLNDEKIVALDKRVESRFPGFIDGSKKYTIKEVLTYIVQEVRTLHLFNLYLMKSFNNNTKKVMNKEVNKQVSNLFIKKYNMLEKGNA